MPGIDRSFTTEPDGSRVRTLVKSIPAHGGRSIAKIRLRPPKYREIMSFGDPSAMIVFNGAVLPHEDMGIVEKYVEALSLDESGAPIDPGLLGQADYRDAIALKDAVLSFFKTAASETSSTPPTS